MAEVMVRGEAVLHRPPDRGVIRLAIEGDGSDQGAAYRNVSERAQTVDAVLDKFATAIDRRSAVGVIVQARTEWTDGHAVILGWTAQRSTVLEVTDLERIGELLSQLSDAGVSSIHGPTWVIDRANPAHAEARRLAAIDAAQRAASYAEALGRQLGELLWVAEPGLRSGGNPIAMHAPAMVARGAMAAGPASHVMDVQSDEITIGASVEVCYAMRGGSG